LQRATATRIDIQDRSKKTSKGAVYCRVSSDKQKDDLQRQVEAMEARFPGYQVFTDVASGLNYKRKGLSRLLERAQSGAIEEVVVAHRDRLARFGVELIEWILRRANARLIFLDQTTKQNSNEELAEDLLAVVHVFSCRLNGKRRYKRTHQGAETRTKPALQEPGQETKTSKKRRVGPRDNSERHAVQASEDVSNSEAACVADEVDERHTDHVQHGNG